MSQSAMGPANKDLQADQPLGAYHSPRAKANTAAIAAPIKTISLSSVTPLAPLAGRAPLPDEEEPPEVAIGTGLVEPLREVAE